MSESMSDVAGTLSLGTYAQRKKLTTDDRHHRGEQVQAPEQLTIVINGTPIAKGRPRFTKTGRAYTPAATKAAEQALAIAWLATVGNRAPHTGPVHVRAQFVFEPPASWTKWKRELALDGRYPHTAKPDVDNLLKVLDGLNGRAWIDDSQLTNVHGRKYYGTAAHTRLIFTFFPAAPTTQKNR